MPVVVTRKRYVPSQAKPRLVETVVSVSTWSWLQVSAAPSLATEKRRTVKVPPLVGPTTPKRPSGVENRLPVRVLSAVSSG